MYKRQLKNLTLEIGTIESKHEETLRARQAVLDRTRDEYEKLLGKYHQLDELYRELTEKRDVEIGKIFLFRLVERSARPVFVSAENEQIRRELENLHQENLELAKEK